MISLDDTLAQHIDRFAEFDHVDERKRSIRIANVLNMQTGLDCDDGVDSSPGNETLMYRRDDWIKYILSVPMQADPGTMTSYCSGARHGARQHHRVALGPEARRLRADQSAGRLST